MEQALSDLTVLDLTDGVAGPFCTKVLACLGAEVIKIEAPGGGDPSRAIGPFVGDIPNPETSGLFLHLNTGKKSLSVDVNTVVGNEIVKRLAGEANIIVESLPPSVATRTGLDYASVTGDNPAAVYTSVSDFGRTGPYAEYRSADILQYAMGGEMCSTGRADRPPIRLADFVMQYQAGNAAAAATLMGFYGAASTGLGQHIDVSVFETAVSSVDRRLQHLMGYIYHGKEATRADNEWALFPVGVYPCKDGYFDVHGGGPINFPRTCQMIGMPELLEDPRFNDPMALVDPQRKDDFDVIFLSWVIQRTREECMEAAREAKLYAAPIYTPEEVMSDPHFSERGSFTLVEHPAAGALFYPGPPGILGSTPWDTRPAPLLGQHTEEILSGRLGYPLSDLVNFRRGGVI